MTSVDAFFSKCMRELMKYGVTIQFVSEEISNINYSFFEVDHRGENPRLSMVYSEENFLDNFPLFLHEYCHFLQWKNGEHFDSTSSLTKFGEWIAYKSEKFSIKDIRNIQQMELDCDKKVIRLVKKYQLPIDISIYKKMTNSYVLSYNYIFEKRIFFHSGFDHPEVMNCVPDRFLSMNEIIKGNQKHKELFLKHSK
jgi:hypothetical protein